MNLLLDQQLGEQSDKGIYQLTYDAIYEVAAKCLLNNIQGWNGVRFELAVREAFEKLGYKIELSHWRYDKEGGDTDILMSMPENQNEVFEAEKVD